MAYTFNPLSGKFDYYNSSSASVTYATKATILASTATQNKLAFATDEYKLYLGDGTDWREVDLPLRVSGDSYGAEQESGLNGFHPDYITKKLIANCYLGDNADTIEGGLRLYGTNIQAYLDGAWASVVTGFVFREDSTGGEELEHDPNVSGYYYGVATGNSDQIASNGFPFTQQYSTPLGANGVRHKVGGGANQGKNKLYLNEFAVAVEPRSDLTEAQIITGNPTMPLYDKELVQASDTQHLFVVEETATPEWVARPVQTLDMALVDLNDGNIISDLSTGSLVYQLMA